MSNFDYIFKHCIPSGFHSIRSAFYFWIRLLQGDLSDYEIYKTLKHKYSKEEMFEMLRNDFWWSLEDDVLPKEFLENLYKLVEEVNKGEVELTPFNIEDFDDE